MPTKWLHLSKPTKRFQTALSCQARPSEKISPLQSEYIMKKTIILAVPYMYGLDQCIEKNLRFLGFDVINLCYDDRDSYYPNLGSRLKNLYHKHITKDGNYKKYLKYSRHLDDIQQKLALLNGKKADYALCIRANIYPQRNHLHHPRTQQCLRELSMGWRRTLPRHH